MTDILISDIQRFSLHDGPGIRTTVFLKGCSLCCPWCSNPENIHFGMSNYEKDGRKGRYGYYISAEELYREVIKDKHYYSSRGWGKSFEIVCIDELNAMPGGVTFSGGECLLQMDSLQPVLEKLKKEGIHIAIESSLYVSADKLLMAIENVDLFYVDIKILDIDKCRDVLNGNLSVYKDNLQRLYFSRKPIVFRIPVIGGYTDDETNQRAVVDLIRSIPNTANVIKIELIKEHSLGLEKWKSLSRCDSEVIVPDYLGVGDAIVDGYASKLRVETNISVEICKI